MPAEQKAVLKVFSEGGVRLSEIIEYLGALEDAYNGIAVFESIVQRHVPPTLWLWPLLQVGPRRVQRILQEKQSLEPLVRPSHRIILIRVSLESPGSWDFVGQLNPLEVIRQWLSDRHERRKDIEYREAAEAQRLALENKILENRVLAERIHLAKELGATDEDLAPLIDRLLYKPLDLLSQQQDKGLIRGIELEEWGKQR